MLETLKAKVIECFDFDVTLNDGTRYRVTCGREEIDKLIDLIGESNVIDCEEL